MSDLYPLRAFVALIAGTVALLSGAAPAQTLKIAREAAQTESKPHTDGRRLFAVKCEMCHATGPLHPGTMSLASRFNPENRVLGMRRGGTPSEYVKQVVRRGLVEMPPISPLEVTDLELDAIATFLARPQ